MTSRHIYLIGCLSIGVGAIASSSWAKTMTKPAASEEHAFSMIAAVDQAEIQAADAAIAKGVTGDALDFAKKMKAEHAANLARIDKLAPNAVLDISKDPAATDLKNKKYNELMALNRLDGKSFENAYMDGQVNGHREVLSMIDNDLKPSVWQPEFRRFVSDTRDHVQDHLADAKHVQVARRD